MQKNHVYLAVSDEDADRAADYGFPMAHLCYRIGTGCRLLRSRSFSAKGGIMVISDTDPNCFAGPVQQFARDIIREYTLHGFCGVVADFEADPSRELAKLFEYLDAAFAARKIPFFVPERFGVYSKTAKILIPTAITGGSLHDRLTEAIQKYGSDRIVMDIQRLRIDFCPSDENDNGVSIPVDRFRQLSTRFPIHRSDDLAANYFIFTEGNTTHFVLFDDADSILEKLNIANEIGIDTAFFLYPEVDDLLSKIERGMNDVV